MNDLRNQQVTSELTKKKFGRKEILESRVRGNYKANLEREYVRLVDEYMTEMGRIIADILDEIFATPMIGDFNPESGFRTDDAFDDFVEYIRQVFAKAKRQVDDKTSDFGFNRKIDKLAKSARTMNANEWARQVRQTLGVDIFKDYYSGEFFRSELGLWVADNVDLITTIPHDILGEMETIVTDGWKAGRYPKDMIDDITSRYDVTRNHAKFIARDQMAKLNSSIAEQQMKDAGVREYRWSTSKDGRVRETHRLLDGTIHQFDDPPIVDFRTGRRANPGQDYQCRCVAIPIFRKNTINLPMEGTTT